MTQDITDDVQQEQVSTTELVSPAEEVKETTPAQALTEERVQELIAQATIKAVEEAKEAGKRELQSAQDRNKAELARMERRAKTAETTLTAARTQVQSIDPEVAKEMELAELRAEKQARTTEEQQDILSQQQSSQAKEVQESLNAYLGELKIDPKDARLDWADDAKDYISGRTRFDASVAKIITEERQAVEGSLAERLKALEAKITAGEIEANSVNTAASVGVVEGSDEDFVKKFASYEIPYNKANVDRYNKIQNS